jgi:carboxypeptidase PM20D1
MPTTILIIVIALLLFLVAFILIRTTLFSRAATLDSNTQFAMPEFSDPGLDALDIAKHLSEAVQVQTISHEDPAEDNREYFTLLQQEFEVMYPRVHQVMQKEVVAKHSLIFTWQGSDPDLEPVVFTSHQDVVPADPNSLNQWTHPPFSGEIADGFIWGRGTLDIKSQVIAIFEAAEALIASSYTPRRSVILAFGHDEEVFGTGAKAIVAHLKEKGIHLRAVLDEGGTIYQNGLPGITGLAALIGTSEKGYLSLKLTVEAEGGHSSTPSQESAIGILSQAITRLEENRFPATLTNVKGMFQGLSPALPFMMQAAFANLWLFKGVVMRQLSSGVETDAAIRTTTAPTIFHSGIKDNVLPAKAEAVVNFRLLPGMTIAQVCDRVRDVIHDERVHFEPLRGNAWEASPVSPTDFPTYKQLSASIRSLFPGTVVAPYITLGGTDARNYTGICENVYRFTPVITTPEDQKRMHGVNERISIDALTTMVKFFHQLIQIWSAD